MIYEAQIVSKAVCFDAGDFLMNDAPWGGRPVVVDKYKIKTFFGNNQHYTTRDIYRTYLKYLNN